MHRDMGSGGALVARRGSYRSKVVLGCRIVRAAVVRRVVRVAEPNTCGRGRGAWLNTDRARLPGSPATHRRGSPSKACCRHWPRCSQSCTTIVQEREAGRERGSTAECALGTHGTRLVPFSSKRNGPCVNPTPHNRRRASLSAPNRIATAQPVRARRQSRPGSCILDLFLPHTSRLRPWCFIRLRSRGKWRARPTAVEPHNDGGRAWADQVLHKPVKPSLYQASPRRLRACTRPCASPAPRKPHQ
jgi:hypothetical protein